MEVQSIVQCNDKSIGLRSLEELKYVIFYYLQDGRSRNTRGRRTRTTRPFISSSFFLLSLLPLSDMTEPARARLQSNDVIGFGTLGTLGMLGPLSFFPLRFSTRGTTHTRTHDALLLLSLPFLDPGMIA